MIRKIMALGVLLAGLPVATPLSAQEVVMDPHIWTANRPDGHAPAAVMSSYLLDKNQAYFGYRYYSTKYRGTLIGTDEISSEEILDFFDVAPLRHDSWTGELDVRYGVSDWATVQFVMPWTRNRMLNETAAGFYETSSEYLGDLEFRGLFDLLQLDEHRLSGTLGVSAPMGNIGKKGTTSTGVRGVLPYTMQGGSGSWDVLLGGTFQSQNAVASIGTQIDAVVRVADNEQGYRYGDEITFTVWGAYNINDWLSFSLRGVYNHMGAMSGDEPLTDGTADPLANSFAQGGERIFIPFGFNLYLRDGRAAGHRLSLEFAYPVHEDLNGPQMSAEQGLIISWQTVF